MASGVRVIFGDFLGEGLMRRQVDPRSAQGFVPISFRNRNLGLTFPEFLFPFPLLLSFALDEFPLSLCDLVDSNVGRQLPATKGPTGASELKPFFFLETQKNHS